MPGRVSETDFCKALAIPLEGDGVSINRIEEGKNGL
jgi:hypothetical protein